MTSGQFKIRFVKRATVPLAENEKVSLWDTDDLACGTIARQLDSITMKGTWRVSAIGNFLGSGILGRILIRPIFEKARTEDISVQHVERIVVGKKWTGKTVYHVFHNRDGGMSEVHTFTAGTETDAPALEGFLRSIVSQDRFHTAS